MVYFLFFCLGKGAAFAVAPCRYGLRNRAEVTSLQFFKVEIITFHQLGGILADFTEDPNHLLLTEPTVGFVPLRKAGKQAGITAREPDTVFMVYRFRPLFIRRLVIVNPHKSLGRPNLIRGNHTAEVVKKLRFSCFFTCSHFLSFLVRNTPTAGERQIVYQTSERSARG